MNIIKIKRGLEQNLNSNLLQDGELAITTDGNNLYSSKGKINRQNVFVGSSEPDDPNIDVWINPQGSDYIVNKIYPIGSIYLSVSEVDPAILFGGVWESFSAGRTLVGVDTSQTEFNTVQKTGGEKTHTLNSNEIPSHSHTIFANTDYRESGETGYWGLDLCQGYAYGSEKDANNGTGTRASGGGEAHNNLQPYITVYMWKRVG